MDEKAIRAAGFDRGYEEGKEKGEKKGEEKGKKNTLENMVKSMILNNIEDEKIKKIAKIDDKELNRIKKLLN